MKENAFKTAAWSSGQEDPSHFIVPRFDSLEAPFSNSVRLIHLEVYTRLLNFISSLQRISTPGGPDTCSFTCVKSRGID